MSGREFCDGVTRRAVIQAGFSGALGLSLPQILRLRAEAQDKPRRQTAAIFLELAGGPTQHETYDPKPTAPVDYRGPLSTTPTCLPGVHFSELMVEQAKIADKLAVLRAVTHDSGSHGTSAHLTQTGYYLRDRQSRENDMPCIGSYVSRIRGSNADGMPAFTSLPRTMRFGRAAWLGKGYNPFITVKDAHLKDFRVANLTLLNGLTDERMRKRQGLLEDFDSARRILDTKGVAEATDRFTREAFDMVLGDAARKAFDIQREDQATRDRYGMNALGQNTLLARRLVEAGVTFVSVRMNSLGSWDDHNGVAKRMKQKGPAYDQAVAALVTDLHERGMADDVIVVAIGEFGRTPKVDRNAGRDHWGRVMSALLAGGGLPVGQIIGASDANGAAPDRQPYRPENILAMMYRHLGIDPSRTFPDNAGRPRYLLERRDLIRELV